MPTRCFRLLHAVHFLVLLLGSGVALGQVPQLRVRRTYYDYAGQQLHEEYQYLTTATSRYSKHGYYKEYDESGVLWKRGNYRNNQAEGRQLEYINVDGQAQLQYDITVRHGIAHGPYIRYKGLNERMSAGSYVDGSREGSWKFYYPEGYEVCTYRNDKKQGPATFYWKSGKVAEQYAYRDDERYNDGDIKSFYEDGRPRKSGHFTDGQMNGKFLAWYPNGQLRYEENYVDGSQEGRSASWYENGQLKAEGRFRANQPDSLLLDYHENGARAQERMWVNGQLNGPVRTFSEQGAVLTETEYRDGQPQPSAAQLAARHVQDSVRQAQADAVAAQRSEAAERETADNLLAEAQHKQQALARADGASALNTSSVMALAVSAAARRPQSKLYLDLYTRLLTDCEQAASAHEKALKAQRLLNLLTLAEALYQGQQPDLNKAIRKENDLSKVLALTGL